MKFILNLIIILTSVIISCSSPNGSCVNCNGDDPNETWKLTAKVEGNLKFFAKTNVVYYYNQEVAGSVFREIKADINDGINKHEIYISFLDKPDDDNLYQFDSNSATVIWTTLGLEPQIYQYNTNGTLTVISVSKDNISATFNFTATQSDSKLKVQTTNGVLNFSR